MLKYILVLLILLTSVSTAKWQRLSSEHFTIFFPLQHKNIAIESLYYLEKNRPIVKTLTGEQQTPTINVVLQDFGNNINGYASVLTRKISFSPPQPGHTYNLIFSNNWLEVVSIHELFHNIHVHAVGGRKKWRKKLFGVPAFHASLPLTFIEGLAVYQESNTNPYQGRLNNGFYESVLLTKAKENTLATLTQHSYYYNQFPMGHWYMYGSGFINYIVQKYSEQAITQFIQKTKHKSTISARLMDYRLKDISNDLFGTSLEKLYEQYTNHLKQKAESWQLPQSPSLLSGSHLSAPVQIGHNLYTLRKSQSYTAPFTIFSKLELIKINTLTQQPTTLKTFYTSTMHQALIKHNRSLFISLTHTAEGYDNIDDLGKGQEISLFEYNTETKALTDHYTGNITAFCIAPNNNILIAKKAPSEHKTNIFELGSPPTLVATYPGYIKELTYHKSTLYAVHQFAEGSSNIYQLQLTNQTMTPIVHSKANESHIHFQQDTLFYTANHNQRYQLYTYNLQTKDSEKITGPSFMAMSNVTNNTLSYVSLNSNGFTLHQQPTIKTTFFKQPPAETVTPLAQQQNFLTFKSSVSKSPLLSKNLKSLFPFLRGPFPAIKNNKFYIGGFMIGQDTLGYLSYSYLAYAKTSSLAISTALLKPFSVNYTRNNLNQVLTIDKTIYRSPINLLQTISLGLYYDVKDLSPILSHTLKKHSYKTTIQHLIPAKQNDPFYIHLINTYYFKQSQLKNTFYYTQNMDHYLNLHNYIIDDTTQEKIYSTSLEYTTKLASIHKSNWQINTALNDLFGVLFVDYTAINPEFYSYGAGLRLEVASLNSLLATYDLFISFDNAGLSLMSFGLTLN